MKSFTNILTSLPNPLPKEGASQFYSYADLLKIVMDRPSERGISVTEMRHRNKIFDACENVPIDNEIKLEDADYQVAKKLVTDFLWGIRHKDITKFVDDFNEAK